MLTVRGRVWRDGCVAQESFELETLDALLADPQALVWVDLVNPSREKLDILADEIGLDDHAVEDSCAEGERVKLSRHAAHLFITTYATDIADDAQEAHQSRLETTQVSVFVLPRGLITVRRGDGFDIDQVVERWDDQPDLFAEGVGALVHGLLDTIVDGHFETIQHLDDKIQDLEDLLFSDERPTSGFSERVYRMRRELVELRRVVLPMREVVASILRRRLVTAGAGGIAVPIEQTIESTVPPTNLDGSFDDLYDHVLRASEWTESLRDMLASIFETNLSLQDARLNTIMKKLAGWAAVIAVPTAVTGWFGQNVPYWGFGSPAGVWASVALIIVGSLGLYLVFRKYDWI